MPATDRQPPLGLVAPEVAEGGTRGDDDDADLQLDRIGAHLTIGPAAIVVPIIRAAKRLARRLVSSSTIGPMVRLARAQDIPTLAAMLTRAFTHDPFFSYLAGDAPERNQRMRDGWTGILRFASARLAHTWTTDDLAGAPSGYRRTTGRH